MSEYKPKLIYKAQPLISDDVNDLVEDLIKAKVVTRSGEQFYADGPNAGKKVGTVRGKGSIQTPEQKSRTSRRQGNKDISKPTGKAHATRMAMRMRDSGIDANIRHVSGPKEGPDARFEVISAKQDPNKISEAVTDYVDKANQKGIAEMGDADVKAWLDVPQLTAEEQAQAFQLIRD